MSLTSPDVAVLQLAGLAQALELGPLQLLLLYPKYSYHSSLLQFGKLLLWLCTGQCCPRWLVGWLKAEGVVLGKAGRL